MKRYTLVIDPSSAIDNNLYVFQAQTVTEAKTKLTGLNLNFNPGFTYCATIGKKEPGNNRYHQILRTDDGMNWNREKSKKHFPYNPESWLQIHEAPESIKRLQKKEAATA